MCPGTGRAAVEFRWTLIGSLDRVKLQQRAVAADARSCK